MGCLFFVLLWTFVAVVLTLCGVGTFASWDITAMPWHWSCLCILYWYIVWTVLLFAILVLLKFIIAWRRERIINQYDPEQRDFIRRMMDRNG